MQRPPPARPGPLLLLAGWILSSTLPHTLAAEAPVSFRNEVMAVLSRGGCNGGPCHGNRNGKGGFKLSLRGEDPDADYLTLSSSAAARRLNLADPAESLLLLKPAGLVPHEGGRRFAPGSADYEILRRWIVDRAPDDPGSAPRLTGLAVTPRGQVVLAPADRVTLKLTATFADGSTRDVTQLACYEAANPIVNLSPDGTVVRTQSGETTVLARYLDRQIAVPLAFVPDRPLFDPARSLPENNFIDRHVGARLRELRLNAAEPCRDETFCRRVHLDLLGTLPEPGTARAFAADRTPDKRPRLVETLLQRPEFAEFWALKWLDLLRADERTLDAKGLRALHEWLRDGIAGGRTLDRLAAELIAARGSTYAVPAANYYRALRTPVERAEATAQVFLGTRLQCAQCHNHPYERWTQDDYHDWTALFAPVAYRVIENRRRDDNDGHEFIGEQIVVMTNRTAHLNPRTGAPGRPRPLGVTTPLAENADRLAALADWLASPRNPLFARTQVNRVWFHLLGRGLVDPVDDFRATNPASHPALLEELTADFVAAGCDLRHVIRRIMASQTYQLSSEPAPGATDGGTAYAFNVVRQLPAETLLDNLTEVCGVALRFDGRPRGTRTIQVPQIKLSGRSGRRNTGDADRFLQSFGKPRRQLTTECERSSEPAMGQAFQLISGPLVQALLTDPDNRLGPLADGGMSPEAVVTELYWRALTRAPSPEELAAFCAKIRAGKDRRATLEDVLWSLLNAKEFVLRH